MSSTTTPRRRAFAILAAAACVVAVSLVPAGAGAAEAVQLGTAADFAVLGAAELTNTGATVIPSSMRIGVSPGTAITGFEGIVEGSRTHRDDAVAKQARLDLMAAYDAAASPEPTSTGRADLGGLILQAGVYAVDPTRGAMELTGTLTLDGAGDADAVFIFQTNSTLTTASSSTVVLTGGAQACNIFWQVGSSATLGTSSVFVGNLLAHTSITVTTDVTVAGRTLAGAGSITGAVTLDDDTFTPATCAASTTTTSGAAPTTTTTPPPTTTTTTAAPTTTTTAPGSTTPTTAPGSTPVGGDPVTTPVAGTPVTDPTSGPGTGPGSGPASGATGAGGLGAPTGLSTAGVPSGAPGTGTATPSARITASAASPGTSTTLARTGLPLGVTSVAGLVLIAFGLAAVRLGHGER